jgi:hypothetical protein
MFDDPKKTALDGKLISLEQEHGSGTGATRSSARRMSCVVR